MTNRAALFARSIQCLSSTVIVMISSMKPSIDASVAMIYTANERGLNFPGGLRTAASPPVVLRIGVAS